MVFPLLLGMALGRVGCHLAGLTDGTYGTATTLPWALDLGDGVARHPTNLYEIGFLLLLAGLLWWARAPPAAAGWLAVPLVYGRLPAVPAAGGIPQAHPAPAGSGADEHSVGLRGGAGLLCVAMGQGVAAEGGR